MFFSKTSLKSAALVCTSLLSISAFSAQEILDDRAPKSLTDNQGERYYLLQKNYRVADGQHGINDDYTVFSGLPADAASLTEKGLYLVTYGATPNGNIPLTLSERSINTSPIAEFGTLPLYSAFNAPVETCDETNDCEVRVALVWNTEFYGLEDLVITSQHVNPATRQLEVTTTEPVSRIDAHMTYNNMQYNFQLFYNADINKYVADLHPDIGSNTAYTVFDVYYTSMLTDGLSYDSNEFNYFSGQIVPEAYFMSIQLAENAFRFYPTISEKTSTVHIHYTINETTQYNYVMDVPANGEAYFNHVMPEFVELNSGDKIEYFATYNVDGVFYDTKKQTAFAF